ncbi:hypothetical protein [Spirosoma flavum]|uniref:DUF481 domain-containing protein n=1 Tax=Spirosoma flavum TaxID=2048557 RepID=A0ABW6AQ95_9BACT
MSKYVLFLLLSLPLSYRTTFAQKSTAVRLMNQTKWEVGTDLLWLINKNILPRYALTVRRNVGTHGAIRIRGGADSYGSATTSYDVQESRAYQIRLGYEYRTFLNDNHAYIFYGLEALYAHDVEFFYDYTLPTTSIGLLAGNSLQYPLWRTTQVEKGGSAFFGYKRFLNATFSVSVESSFQYSIWNDHVLRSGLGETDYHSVNYRVFPLTTVNISVHF